MCHVQLVLDGHYATSWARNSYARVAGLAIAQDVCQVQLCGGAPSAISTYFRETKVLKRKKEKGMQQLPVCSGACNWTRMRHVQLHVDGHCAASWACNSYTHVAALAMAHGVRHLLRGGSAHASST